MDTYGAAMVDHIEVSQELIDESRAVNAAIEEMLAANPSVHTVPPAETRAARAEGRSWQGPIVHAEGATWRTAPGPGGEVPLRVLAGERADAIYLHIHGGGWVLGAADQQDALLQTIATGAGVVVVSVDYRLAPEHPFPAGPDDCAAAAAWILEHAGEEWGTTRVVIGGESAGAHLAALTLLRLRDELGTVDAVSAANLVFGAYDLSGTPSQRRWGDRNLVLSEPIMRWFYEEFTPGLTPEERRAPEISPLYADLTGMPPALFTVGALDPLLDDSLFMASRWRAAGAPAELAVYPESIHGFHALPTAIGRRSIEQQVAFVRQHAAG